MNTNLIQNTAHTTASPPAVDAARSEGKLVYAKPVVSRLNLATVIAGHGASSSFDADFTSHRVG